MPGATIELLRVLHALTGHPDPEETGVELRTAYHDPYSVVLDGVRYLWNTADSCVPCSTTGFRPSCSCKGTGRLVNIEEALEVLATRELYPWGPESADSPMWACPNCTWTGAPTYLSTDVRAALDLPCLWCLDTRMVSTPSQPSYDPAHGSITTLVDVARLGPGRLRAIEGAVRGIEECFERSPAPWGWGVDDYIKIEARMTYRTGRARNAEQAILQAFQREVRLHTALPFRTEKRDGLRIPSWPEEPLAKDPPVVQRAWRSMRQLVLNGGYLLGVDPIILIGVARDTLLPP